MYSDVDIIVYLCFSQRRTRTMVTPPFRCCWCVSNEVASTDILECSLNFVFEYPGPQSSLTRLRCITGGAMHTYIPQQVSPRQCGPFLELWYCGHLPYFQPQNRRPMNFQICLLFGSVRELLSSCSCEMASTINRETHWMKIQRCHGSIVSCDSRVWHIRMGNTGRMDDGSIHLQTIESCRLNSSWHVVHLFVGEVLTPAIFSPPPTELTSTLRRYARIFARSMITFCVPLFMCRYSALVAKRFRRLFLASAVAALRICRIARCMASLTTASTTIAGSSISTACFVCSRTMAGLSGSYSHSSSTYM